MQINLEVEERNVIYRHLNKLKSTEKGSRMLIFKKGGAENQFCCCHSVIL